ncbi:hypothetical protein MANY_46440 [Mycolicibacterium anyangense]|uniref:DUF732 domain-containing protein n=1 Tax=Mycolicibacterium anyangense TaxID=1431246 RepID=A0A6N4WGJ6_9MYCO|nr:hypothetical protein [Mycolicibacterium anyangense]BBZ79307.1 hypothetical protein MANY_46440 [Mycolicibacterium anyangense]
MTRQRVGLAVLTAVLVLAGAGCAEPIPGAPVAVPGQAGKPLAPADLSSTTCRQYLAMDDATRRAVIKAIGEKGNQLIGLNPEVWVGVASALCTFVDPSAPVRDILIGQGLR